jgi:hypothetical protein
MPSPREQPLRWLPRGVSDAQDGDNVSAGAMLALTNLLFDPGTPGVYVCRPANTVLSSFAGFSSPGVISAGFILNGILYGMVATSSPAGKDYPFAYNISSGAFLTISGVTSAKCPTTQPTTGDWTPPTIDAIGTKIIVTHPGFSYVSGQAFGYFDISNFSLTTTGDTTSGSPTITGNPSTIGLAPGYPITGTGIPANTTIVNYVPFSLTTTGTITSGTSNITNVANTTGLAVNQAISGLGIPSGAVISGISGTTVSMNLNATATQTAESIFFTGATITLSANATASANNVSLTATGGTLASPLWATGNTTGQVQIAGVAAAVKAFSNRLWFAQSNNLVFTDTLSLNVSNASGVQVLTVGDSTPITALGGLPEYTSSAGILQALVPFKESSIWQINGDIALNNLALNNLHSTIGTKAPRSLALTPDGLSFMTVDGIRIVTLVGSVSEVNTDLAIPFIYAQTPSRVAACFNADNYRICTKNTKVLNSPYQEYHYNAKYASWTGPHTFPYDLILPYQNNFIVFSNAHPGQMFKAYSVLDRNSEGNTFVELGTQLMWQYQTVPMTDVNNMYANCCVRSTLDMALPSTGDTYIFQAWDSNTGVVAQAVFTVPFSEAVWDAFNWGDGTEWGAQQLGLQPITIPWTEPPIFNRLSFEGSGNSSLGLKLGSLYTGYEKLGYLKQ